MNVTKFHEMRVQPRYNVLTTAAFTGLSSETLENLKLKVELAQRQSGAHISQDEAVMLRDAALSQ